MKKEAKDKHFIKQPWYEGGPKALKAYVAQHLHYPEAALQHRVEGTVYVKFDIDYTGTVIEAKAISGPGFGCEEEAIRLVKTLRYHVEKARGVRVIYHKSIQIHFRLPAAQPLPAEPIAVAVQYNYVPSSKKEESPTPAGSTGGYTISWG